MRARGFNPAAVENEADRRLSGTGRGWGSASPASAPAATTFDALFAPLPSVETVGRVWVYVDNQLKPVRVRTGVSDGQNSELIDGDLQEGADVVTNVVVTGTDARPAATGAFPGLGQPQRGGFPGGGNRGGGGRGR
jgi:hypothetical protein